MRKEFLEAKKEPSWYFPASEKYNHVIMALSVFVQYSTQSGGFGVPLPGCLGDKWGHPGFAGKKSCQSFSRCALTEAVAKFYERWTKFLTSFAEQNRTFCRAVFCKTSAMRSFDKFLRENASRKLNFWCLIRLRAISFGMNRAMLAREGVQGSSAVENWRAGSLYPWRGMF